MKIIRFTQKNRSGDLLQIELPGCVVNIRVNLARICGDGLAQPVTRIDILPDDETRMPDIDGYYWHLAEDGARVIRDAQPAVKS